MRSLVLALVAVGVAAKGSVSQKGDQTEAVTQARAAIKRHMPRLPLPPSTTSSSPSRVLEDDFIAQISCLDEIVLFGDCLTAFFGDDYYYYYYDGDGDYYYGYYYDDFFNDDFDRYEACEDLTSGGTCLAVFDDIFDDDFLDSGICPFEFENYLTCYFSVVCQAPVTCTAPQPPSGGSKKKKSSDDDDSDGATTAIIVVCVLVGLLLMAAAAGYVLGYIQFTSPSRWAGPSRLSLMVPQHVPGSEPKTDAGYAVM